MNRLELINLFLKLAALPSPSGKEGPVANFIGQFLNAGGWQVKYLRDGTKNDSDSGNVLASLAGGDHKVLLCAHMDTVQADQEIVKPKFKHGVFSSDGSTILGADNKAGVVLLLALAQGLTQLPSRPTVYLLFTTREEKGKMGSSLVGLGSLGLDLILNVDGGKPPGTIDVAALGQKVFKVCVLGKAAHAALQPEKGIHAIKIAAEIVLETKMGRNLHGDVVNLGKIEGGTQTNVIPGEAVLWGEARSFDKKRLKDLLVDIKSRAQKIAKKYGARIKFEILTEAGVPVWETKDGVKFQEILAQAAQTCALKPVFSQMPASSDANYLAQWGIPTFNINRGGKNSHSVSESITVSEMVKIGQFLQQIILSMI